MAKNDSLVVMRALVLTDQGVRYRDDWPEPQPASGDVLVRVLRAGICDTDLQLIQGYKGFTGVLGHEFVGLAQSGPLAGQRVVGEINCSCWTCETCRAGRPGHCPSRSVLGILDRDGAFADLVALPQRNLHAIPDSISTDVAVFVEPVAAAFEIPSQVRIDPHARVVILGDGRLGNLCAQVLAGISDRVTVIGKHQEKLAVIRSMGVETSLLDAWSSTRDADVVVDCTGSPTGLSTALAIVRPRGTIVLKTTLAGTQTANWSSVVVDEVTIVGSRCGPFDRAIAALADGTVDVAPLISERYPLSDGVAALARAGAGSVLKVLLEVS
jgi:threonine dehydrogenase-like Zn-dependent dehydrogenase